MAQQLQFLNIGQAEKEDSSSLYVFNRTTRKGVVPGTINMTVTESNGKSALVRMPVTDIPIDLTTQNTKSAILQSPHFRRLVATQMVGIISEDHAMKLLDSDDARREQNRVLNIIANLDDSILQNTAPDEVKALTQEANEELSGIAMNIGAATEDEDAVLRQLKQNQESLTTADLQYITRVSTLPKVKAHAAERIVG